MMFAVVVVPELLMLLLLRTTPPITLLVFAVEPVIVPAKVRLVLESVTPPMELDAVAVPMKLLERVVAELLMFPPLMSSCVEVDTSRMNPGTKRLLVRVVPQTSNV